MDVSSVPGGMSGTHGGAGGLPTAAVVALPVGAFAVLALIAWIVYYVKSERRIRKEGNAIAPHRGEIKDLTTPCLPQPPPPDAMHHRFQTPNCIPYSVPYH